MSGGRNILNLVLSHLATFKDIQFETRRISENAHFVFTLQEMDLTLGLTSGFYLKIGRTDIFHSEKSSILQHVQMEIKAVNVSENCTVYFLQMWELRAG